MEIRKLNDVFGVGREIPLNYVERGSVDGSFVSSLGRDKHVVIYGSSKQGKTTLRKHCLSDDDYIVVSCTNKMSLSDLHGSILKVAGFRIEQTNTKTIGGKTTYGATFSGEKRVPLVAGVSVDVHAARERNEEELVETQALEIDLSDPNDIIGALKSISFKKFIVLEDFHYLPVETQRDFSFAMKTFHEDSRLCFIVIGVWREKNRIIYYNGDLTNRVTSIDADVWSAEDLLKVISSGEQLLNVEFEDRVKREIVEKSVESVALLQEACRKICEADGVFETQKAHRVIGQGADIPGIMKGVVDEQAGRYVAFLNNFAEGFQKTEYNMYKWLIYAVLKSSVEELERGLRRKTISELIQEAHPAEKLNEGNITQALQNAASLQIQKNIRPIILDYDQTTKVST